jgi:hypothetical protein
MKPLAADPKARVEAIALPYTVPVDVIIRTLQIGLLFGAGYALYSCIESASNVPAIDWAAVISSLALSVVLQFRTSGLSIDTAGIHHRSWWGRTRDLPWQAIESVATGTQDVEIMGVRMKGSFGRIDPLKGTYLMVVGRRDGQPPFILNIKPYSMRGIATVVRVLEHRTTDAVIDESTRKMVHGIVPSIFFGEQKGRG